MTHTRIPSLNWLRVFEAAAREENFARAAQKLNMSGPAVSQQIKALEDHLGCKLFQRSPQKVRLTPEGAAFLPVVQQSLASVETTAAALFGTKQQTTITLQAVTIMAASWLPEHLAAFEVAHPGLRVNVITAEALNDFRTILPGREPDLQIAFGSATDFPASAEPFLRERLQVVATPALAARITSAEDLSQFSLFEVAAHRSGWHQILMSFPDIDLRAMDFRMVDTTSMALSLASQSLGFALSRAPVSDKMRVALGLQPCDLFAEISGQQRYFFLSPGGGSLSKNAAKLKAFLKSKDEG